MVQIGERQWTMDALHAACVLARRTSAKIALVLMVPVQHASWLGTDWGYATLPAEVKGAFADYQATIEDYGLDCVPTLFQYVTWVEGTLQAAAQVDARIVFVPEPHSHLPLWTRFQRWMMRRQFARQGRDWAAPSYPRVAVEADEVKQFQSVSTP